MEDDAAEKLDVVVPLADDAFRHLAHHRERLRQEIVLGLALFHPRAEFHSLAAKLLIAQCRYLRLKRIHLVDQRFHRVDDPLVRSEQFLEKIHMNDP